jgi:hypothetical protein
MRVERSTSRTVALLGSLQETASITEQAIIR